ncbi:MAG: hypothetical protein J6T10_21520 [Methanobrevibacter sp.]|nr:hypothetical protein [Methanobrevibacter sp.]
MPITDKLKVRNDSELLSYMINISPELREDINLPVQGQSLVPIGKLIVSNERYKNAFINAINVIGLTLIHRNYWEDPWENFTNNGVMYFGDSFREMAVDIADVFDYNTYATDVDHFLENVVPDVYEYVHRLNYQKFYKTTTSDAQMAMAFATEGGLLTLVDEIVSSLWEGYKYDKYIVNKYMLCRRIVDGTVTSVQIPNYDSLTARQRVSFLKSVSNKLIFRNPNYNPMGMRIATPFEKQIAILNTDFEADMSTEVLATSFFRNDAEMKTRLALIDGYGNHDVVRLTEVLGDQFIPFTSDELAALANVPVSIIDDEFFQNKTYALDNVAETELENVMSANTAGIKRTSFYNPETLKNNHWLHYWGVKATSPMKQAVVFTKDAVGVTTIAVSPESASLIAGSELKLASVVTTTGFANKAVLWSVDSTSAGLGVTIDQSGLLKVPSTVTADTEITVTATSIADSSKTATATITVASSTIPSITSVTVTAAGSATTIAASSTLQMSASVVKVGNPSTDVTWSVDTASATDGFTISSTGLLTAPESPTVAKVTVTATSIFDTSKKGTKELTVGNARNK